MRMSAAISAKLRQAAGVAWLKRRGDAGIIAIAHQNIGGSAAQELFERLFAARNRQVEHGAVEAEPADRLRKAHRRAEEEPVVGALFRLRTAEIDEADRNAPADQPAGDAVQDDPIGAVGEGRTRVAGIPEFDLGQTIADDEPPAGIVEHDIEEAQRPA
jgi:hypothetical protein